jgi:hypothetical protein
MTASRVISIVAGRKFTEQFSKGKPSNSPSKGELVRRDERSRQAEIEYQRGRAKREQQLVKIQADLAKMREIEIKAGIEIAAAEAEREERALDLQELRFKADMQIVAAQVEREERALEISERTLQLKKQELELAKARLRQEGKIAEAHREQVERALQLREQELQLMAEELTERRKLSYLYLDLMREKEAKEIELKLTEIQAKWDRENWSGILSREEMRQILVEGQKKHRLLMLVSPPDISEDCPQSFRRNLQMEVRSELKEFIQRHYPFNSDLCPVEFYGKFFKHSVFDAEAKQLERDLAPVSTVIIYSDITDQNVYFHISFWGLQEPISLTLPSWNWAKEKEKLEAEGKTETASFLIIRQSIVKIHQLLAAFLADFYYLNINPTHEPRLFQLEDDLPLEWVHTHFDDLREMQREKLAEFNRPKYKPITRFKR